MKHKNITSNHLNKQQKLSKICSPIFPPGHIMVWKNYYFCWKLESNPTQDQTEKWKNVVLSIITRISTNIEVGGAVSKIKIQLYLHVKLQKRAINIIRQLKFDCHVTRRRKLVKDPSCNRLVSQLCASFANLIRKLNKVVLIFLCLQMFLNIGQHLPMSMTQPQI